MYSIDEAAVDEDRVLAFSAHEGGDDVKSELTVSCARAEEDLVGMVELAGEVDFAVGVFGDRSGAVARNTNESGTEDREGGTDSMRAGRRTVSLLSFASSWSIISSFHRNRCTCQPARPRQTIGMRPRT